MQYIGKITFENKFDAFDPCYGMEAKHLHATDLGEKGTYDCYVKYKKESPEDRAMYIEMGFDPEEVDKGRPGHIIILKENEDIHYAFSKSKKEIIEYLPVDAGMIGFFEKMPNVKDQDDWYNWLEDHVFDGLDPKTLSRKCLDYKIIDDGKTRGFYSRTNYGDGVYPLMKLTNGNKETIGYIIQMY